MRSCSKRSSARSPGEERMREFVREAMAADAAIEAGADVYRADDVHGWLDRLARGGKAKRPAPWRR